MLHIALIEMPVNINPMQQMLPDFRIRFERMFHVILIERLHYLALKLFLKYLLERALVVYKPTLQIHIAHQSLRSVIFLSLHFNINLSY